FVPGSATITVGGTTDTLPTAAGPNAQTLDFDLAPAFQDRGCATGLRDTVIVTLDIEPPAKLGTPLLGVVARADGVPYAAQGAGARVDDRDDPGETAATAAPLGTGSLRTGYISTADDADAYVIDAPPVGSTVTVVLSHLPADYDLAITGPAVGIPSAPLRSSPLRSSPLRSSPLRSSTIADDGVLPTGSATPSALQDLPLRSSELVQSPLRSSSINRGMGTESATFTVTPDDVGKKFTVRVTGYDSARSDDPYVLRAEVQTPKAAPQCRAPRNLPSAPKGAFPSLPLAASTKTVFLINEQRLAQLYPTADIAALRAKLDALAARPEVAGAVVPVESDTANPTGSAYAAWDADPCSVTAANGVAGAIRAVLGNVTQNLDDLKSIVVVGGDAVIPQVRVPDLVGTANEREEADAAVFGGRDSAASRSLRDGFLLTDDAYGDFDPEASLGGATFVPDVALGRLVEKPAEIVAQLDQYTASSGSLATGTTHVSGYDFLTDGAQEILAQLTRLPESQSSSRIDETWTAADAAQALNRPAPGITSVNAHYDHYRALPAAAFNGLVPDLLKAKDVRPEAGSLLFTAGCHAGLNLEDADHPGASGADADRLQDWVQQVTTRAVYIANTTYGYGDTETVAYTERLLGLLADGIASREVTAGQALMLAKQRYAAELATPGVYDQKSSMGLTFYGLPFFTIGASGGEGPAVLPQSPPAGTQVRSSSFSVEPSFVRHDLSDGTGRAWWSVGTEAPQATHNKPIQPRTTLDVTATDGLPVHGAVVEDLSSDYEFGISGVYSQPTIDLSANEPTVPEGEHDGTVFPSWLLRTTRGATSGGLRDQLVVVPGQYIQDWRIQTLYRRIQGQVLRSDSTDYDPPQITSTEAFTATPEGGSPTVKFTVRTPSTDAVRALVLYRPYTFSSDWSKVELTLVPGTDRWEATAPIESYETDLSYSVQLVDRAGNVGVSTNKGTEFPAKPASRERAPELEASPAPPASGYAKGPVTITLDPGSRQGVSFQVSVDGAAPQPYTGPFTITGDGTHTVRFTGSDGTEGGTLVRIDTTAPAVAGSTSVNPSPEGFLAGPVTITWACTDGVSGVDTCPAPTTISTETDGVVVASTPATDRAENTGTGSIGPLSVDFGAPTVTVGATSAAGALTTTPTPLASPTSVAGTAADTLAGVRSVFVTYTSTTNPAITRTVEAAVSCTAADRRSCTWSAVAPTETGTWNVTAVVTDRAGRTTTGAGSAPITTGGSTGGGGGGGNPPPVCTPKVSISWEWRTIEVTVTIGKKKVVVKSRVLVSVTITLPCCTVTIANLKDKPRCATRAAASTSAVRRQARARAIKIAKAKTGTRRRAPDRITTTTRILPR
ncbi:MAG: hypothetical protein JHD16_11140, partial [Solirubrobacteraceae bacterium]|nr:hypothetical protein [Solirubrobacteraceae bacterium]